VSDFPQLRSITIPFFDVECNPEEAASKLLGPQVSYFGWSWSLCGQSQYGIDAFSQEQVDWLTKFLSAAKSKKSRLRRIHIDYQPEFYRGFYGNEVKNEELKYPFDRIDCLAQSFATQGVELTYEKPYLTKEDFLNQLETYSPNTQNEA
jgi:hypothetical protein